MFDQQRVTIVLGTFPPHQLLFPGVDFAGGAAARLGTGRHHEALDPPAGAKAAGMWKFYRKFWRVY